MRLVDRGGLFHVSDDTYEFFKCIEMLVRKVFHKDNIQNINPETKNKLSNNIMKIVPSHGTTWWKRWKDM